MTILLSFRNPNFNVHPFLFNNFQKSQVPEFKKAWEGMVEFNKTKDWVLSGDSSEHYKHVMNGKYAYIGDMTQIEMWRSEQCDLRVADEKFLPLQYAIALSKNSPFTKLFDAEYVSFHICQNVNCSRVTLWYNYM